MTTDTLCDCGFPLQRRTAGPNAQHPGKHYYVCPRRYSSDHDTACRFFQWEEPNATPPHHHKSIERFQPYGNTPRKPLPATARIQSPRPSAQSPSERARAFSVIHLDGPSAPEVVQPTPVLRRNILKDIHEIDVDEGHKALLEDDLAPGTPEADNVFHAPEAHPSDGDFVIASQPAMSAQSIFEYVQHLERALQRAERRVESREKSNQFLRNRLHKLHVIIKQCPQCSLQLDA